MRLQVMLFSGSRIIGTLGKFDKLNYSSERPSLEKIYSGD